MGKTATQISKEIGCSVATVTKYAKEFGLGRRHGYAFVLTDSEAAKIKKAYKPNLGRKPKL